MATAEPTTPKSSLEALSKDELINKYKGLLNIAKKAKQAKDELVEENRTLKESLASSEIQKEADKNALKTMQEMLENFTTNKLELTTRVSELERHARVDNEALEQLRIENESLKRQLARLNDDNETLLADIDRMEEQLKQVNLVGIEQRKHLSLLEPEVNKLKESESLVLSLQDQLKSLHSDLETSKLAEQTARTALTNLEEKYKMVKGINSEQRTKFNALKDRFVEVHRKLKQLKECKCVLMDTQQEYYENVSKWQKAIVKASQRLCAEMNKLKLENEELLKRQQIQQTTTGTTMTSNTTNNTLDLDRISMKLAELYRLSERVYEEQKDQINRNKNDEEQESSSDAHNLTIQRYQQELQDLRAKIAYSSSKLAELHQENANMRKLLSAKETQTKEEKEAENWQATEQSYQVEINDLKAELQSLQQTLEEQTQTQSKSRQDHEEALSLHKQQLKELNEQLTEFEQRALKWQNEAAAYKQQISELNERLLSEVSNQELSLELNQQLTALQEKNAQLSEQLKKYTESSQKTDEELLQYRQSYDELKQSYILKEREHKDLLDEMRELNEILKTRGDVISRQQEKQQELQAELKQITTKLKQSETKLLESQNLNKEQKQQHNSFSLELETTQKRSAELEAALKKSEEHLQELQVELQTLRASTVNQPDFDAQSDVMSTASAMSRAEEFARMRDVEDSFEEKYNKLRSLAVKLKKKLQEQTAHINELEKQNAEVQSTSGQDLKAAKEQVLELQAKQEQLQKQVDTLKADNQKLKSSRKQSSVLNLEIEAAERSLNEVTARLAAKNNEIEAQKSTIETQENAIKQLRQEIAILESAKEAECTHSKDLKTQIDLLQSQLKDAVHGKQSAVQTTKELEQALEQLKLTAEEQSLQLANAASKHDIAIKQLQSDKAALSTQLQQAESTIQQQQASIKKAERSLEDMRVEYLEYKVKAQAVLRKNQSRDSTKEHELEEELQALRQNEQQWHARAQEQQAQLEQSNKQIEMLNEDNANLQRRSKELLNVVEELRQQYETVALENQRMMQTQQETMRQHRQQIEQLDACHKLQLQEATEKQQQQLEALKAEQARLMRLPPIVGNTGATNANTYRQHHAPLTTEQSKIDFLLMEREDAEGSEEAVETLAAKRKISNASRRSQHDFMPLDELLNAPMHTINSDTVRTITEHSFGGGNSGSTGGHSDVTIDNTHLELQTTKERLHNEESRVRHLTALLAENEQDLAKLTQMNDMLKEELRRQERGVEREKHMHNSEYLKNVILKFLTLNNGDEKQRLVPVLNTILRLSRTEAELLNNVAKGQKGDRSWSSYLTAWTGSPNSSSNNN